MSIGEISGGGEAAQNPRAQDLARSMAERSFFTDVIISITPVTSDVEPEDYANTVTHQLTEILEAAESPTVNTDPVRLVAPTFDAFDAVREYVTEYRGYAGDSFQLADDDNDPIIPTQRDGELSHHFYSPNGRPVEVIYSNLASPDNV